MISILYPLPLSVLKMGSPFFQNLFIDLKCRHQVTPSFKTFFDKRSKSQLVALAKIEKDKSPFPKIFAPDDPAADKDGFVYESNVRAVLEMADMREAARSHEGCLKAYERILSMLQNTINLLKN